ncbi:Uncharacterised protein [Cedecea lapagei]|uniref:Uncharacterized protein n=1 Tax=Cedecea lapagei TaxID=158823 RepID=A0A447V6A0_9ENTR|nr:Uncharacterised protein [Cedecea lapagei]
MDGIARMPWVKIKNCNLILNKKLDVSLSSEKNRMKVAVISENSYLSLGISSILSCANGGGVFF